MKPFQDPAVAAKFKAYPPKIRPKLMAIRRMIFDTAAATEGVGKLQETLKWGAPAYITARPEAAARYGSTGRRRSQLRLRCSSTAVRL